MRSGFVALVGRPNVGKSTLLNRILGTKVSITSEVVQTTRSPVRGIFDRADAQMVFVDTPGVHRPRTPLGERCNRAAVGATAGTDVVVLVLDATARLGPGDRWVADRVPDDAVVAVNKIDRASRAQTLDQLARAGELDRAEYFPVSAGTGEGVNDLTDGLIARLADGPRYYPEGTVAETPEAAWVAELVREQLLARLRDEVPHSVATRVTDWDWPVIRCEILVERESQKPIVIGRGGRVLKEVGTAVRAQLPEGAHIDLVVSVEDDWQRRPAALDRLGFT